MKLLSRLLSRTSTSSSQSTAVDPVLANCSFLDLPQEILLLIEANLAYENVIALSLTCKALYVLMFRRYKPSPKHHGREARLLRLIERDLPDYLSCAIHQRLYKWRVEKSRHYQCPQCLKGRGRSLRSYVICNKGCNSGFYGIFEPERRLILRYALRGPQYGIPSRVLDHICKNGRSKRANECIPRIVDDSLMVWRSHHITLRIDFQFWHELALETLEEAFCIHSETNLQALACAAVRHARERRDYMLRNSAPLRKLSDAHWECPLLFKCLFCSTDVRLRMDQVATKKVIIRFDAYQDLGGLAELNTSQRQVLTAKYDSNQKMLSAVERLSRLRENLEKRYHGEEEQGIGSDSSLPRDTCFLYQYTYSTKRNPENPVTFRASPMLPQEFNDNHRTIRFVLQDDNGQERLI